MPGLSRRWIWRIALCLSILVVIGLLVVGLALRYWYVPHASDYRDKIAALISRTADTPITIEAVQGSWEGLRPTLEFKNVTVLDANNNPAVKLDRIHGVLSWWSLLYGSIEFYRLEIDQPTLAMRRDKSGKLFLAGIELPQGDPSGDAGLADWLLQQRNVVVNNGIFAWQDAMVSDQALLLSEVGFRLENRGNQHNFGLAARPPSEIADPIAISGSVRGATFGQLRNWRGSVQAELQNVDLATLRRFIPIPEELRQGSGGVKLTFTGDGRGHIGASTVLDLKNVQAQFNSSVAPLELTEVTGTVGLTDLAPGFEVTTDNLAVTLRGAQQSWRPGNAKIIFHPGDAKSPERGEIHIKQIDLTGLLVVLRSVPFPADMNEQLRKFAPSGRLSNFVIGWARTDTRLAQYQLKGQFQDLTIAPHDDVPGFSGMSGSVDANQIGGGLALDSKALIVKAPTIFVEDLKFDTLTGRATWKTTRDGVDVTINSAAFANNDAAMTVTGRYKSVAGTPGWTDLNGTLLRGDARGLWRYVPRVVPNKVRDWLRVSLLAGKSESGSFQLKGNLYDFPFIDDKGGVFEFIADAHDGVVRYVPDWPSVEDISAKLIFRGMTMDVIGHSGRVFQSKINIARIRVADLAHHDPIVALELRADTSVQDGLRFIAESRVKEFIHHATDRFVGNGNSKFDLQASIPLARLQETRVIGDWEFLNAKVTDKQETIPDLEKINGHLAFTERGIDAKQLRGETLGGPAQASFATDKDHKLTINTRGVASAQGLVKQYKNPALKYFSGTGDWSGIIQVQGAQTAIKIGARGTLLGGPATMQISNEKDGAIRIDGSGNAALAGMKQHFDADAMKYVTSDAAWNGSVTVREKGGQLKASAKTNVLGTPAQFDISTSPDGATTITGGGNIETATVEKELPLAILKDFSKTAEWKTTIKIKDNKNEIGIDAQAKLYGEPIDIHIVRRGVDGWDIRASGNATPRMIKQIWPQPWVDTLSGASRWSGQFEVRGKKYSGQIKSDLGGLASALPAPLAKSAADVWPSRVDILQRDAKQELWRIKLGDQLNAQLVLRETGDGKRDIPQGEIAFRRAATDPARAGLWLSGRIDNFDADGWRALNKRLDAASKSDGEAASAFSIGGVEITAANMTLFDRRFVDFQIKAEKGKTQWLIGVDGNDVRGNALWQPEGAGFISARFSQLHLPAANPVAPNQSRPAMSNPGRLPSMDITADSFQIGQRKLGRLELLAKQEGQDWRIERARISSPAGVFNADGVWQGWLDQPQTALNVNLRVSDLGQFLGNVGYPGTVKRGNAEINGQVSWIGDPHALDPQTLSGNFTLIAKSGQFLKVQPGVGKLLGLISLQALPKRITLDFRDIFSDGFTFDDISATVKMDLGELKTDDFFMRGSAAGVIMQGSADARTETQNLKVKVIPSLAETIAVAGGLAGGPIVGVGAYILQKILQNPFDKIFAYEYTVTGKWDDPIATKVARSPAEKKTIRR